MKSTYSSYFPTAVHFGSGIRGKLPEVMDSLIPNGDPRVFLVASNSVRKQAIGQELTQLLGRRLIGEYTKVPHDPPISCVDEIIAEARAAGANCFLAAGGGSVMDACKTAAFLARESAPVAHFFRNIIPMPRQGMPMAAIPTTSGTGAEITKNAVLTDTERDLKASIRATAMVPAVALIDPDFTLGLPKRITADSGLDALTQAIESYISEGANNLTQPLAARAVALLMKWLPIAYANGNDPEARIGAAEGSMLDALAFAQSGLGAVHGLAHPIGHRLNTAHGFTCAVLLPHVMRFNLPVRRNDFDALAIAAGCANAEDLIDKVQQLCEMMEVPRHFQALTPADIPYIIKNCRSGSMKANPRPMSDADVESMLVKLMVNH